MIKRLKHLLLWLVLVALLGLVASYFFDVHFWTATAIAAVALVANGLFSEWEDRQPGGFYNPKDHDE